jgi:hypothetical protein
MSILVAAETASKVKNVKEHTYSATQFQVVKLSTKEKTA